MKENQDCINSLISRFKISGRFKAYQRDDLVGHYYLTPIFLPNFKLGEAPDHYEWVRIDAATELDQPHYIFDGIALKVKVPLYPEGWWIYGCYKKYISPREDEIKNA